MAYARETMTQEFYRVLKPRIFEKCTPVGEIGLNQNVCDIVTRARRLKWVYT